MNPTDIGYWLLVTGTATGYCVLGTGYWVLGTGYWVLVLLRISIGSTVVTMALAGAPDSAL